MNPLKGKELKIGCLNHMFYPGMTRRVMKIVGMRRQSRSLLYRLCWLVSPALLLTALSKLYEMTIGIAQEGAYLIAPVHRWREELGSARA